MTIQEILDNILHAVFGKDVRQSMHDGVKRANDICEETEARQTALENKYDLLLRNCTELSPSDSEIVDARIKEDGTVYYTLGKRLDVMDAYDTELEAARIKEDGTVYNTLGERLKAMDIRADNDGESTSKTFEQYLPRIGRIKKLTSSTGLVSQYCIEDESITSNAKMLLTYTNGDLLIGPSYPIVTIDDSTRYDRSKIQTYADADAGRLYLRTEDSTLALFLEDSNVIYVRDILGA